MVGETDGALPGYRNAAGASDIFLRKYTAGGRVVWSTQSGTGDIDEANDIALDQWGVLVAGQTVGTWPGQTKTGFFDPFVRKYSRSGDLWGA